MPAVALSCVPLSGVLKVMAFGAPQVIAGVALLTVIVRSTSVAALKFVLPAWLARIVTLPAPVIVSAFPVTDAGPLITENATAKPESDEPVNVIALTPNVWLPGPAKVIVWFALLTVM